MKEHLASTKRWCATVHKHLRGTVNKLEVLKNDPKNPRPFAEAKKHIRSAMESERILNHRYGFLKGGLSELEGSKSLEATREKLESNAAVLVAEQSYIRKGLNNDLKELAAQLELFRKKKTDYGEVVNAANKVIAEVKGTIAEKGDAGLVPFSDALGEIEGHL